MIMNNISNDVLNNSAQSFVQSNFKLIEAVNFTIISLTTLSIACNVLALWMVFLCKTLPAYLTFTSTSFLLSNLLGTLSVLLFRMVIYGFEFKDPILDYIQFITTGSFFSISTASITFMSVNRVIVVSAPHSYKRVISAKVVGAILCMVWVLIIAVSLTAWALEQLHFVDKNPSYRNIPRRINTGIRLTFSVITTLTCGMLVYRLNTSQTILFHRRFYRVTRILIMIIVAHTLFDLPSLVNFTLSEIIPNAKGSTWSILLQIVGFVCISANSVFDACIYTFSIKEYKRKVCLTFCRK